MTPTPRRPGKPYRVLYSLLYSRFAWADRRDDGTLQANTAKYARALGLRTRSFKDALAYLKDRGDLDRLTIGDGWFIAQPRCPPGMARLIGPPPALAPFSSTVRAPWVDVPDVIDVEVSRE